MVGDRCGYGVDILGYSCGKRTKSTEDPAKSADNYRCSAEAGDGGNGSVPPHTQDASDPTTPRSASSWSVSWAVKRSDA